MTFLAKKESACGSTVDALGSALKTRRKYSSDPVFASDMKQLVAISSRWVDECPHMTSAVHHGEQLDIILRVADFVVGHSAGVFRRSSSFYRSRRLVASFSVQL